jgi:hypothetical protein
MTTTSFSKSARIYTIMILMVLSALLVKWGRRIWSGTLWVIGGPGADMALTLHRAMLRCRQHPTNADGVTSATIPAIEPANQ